MTVDANHQLKRGLKSRHIQLIALGGAIGTGLFLGIAQTIRMAGPSVLLGYAVAGAIAFLIMRQLGEMVVDEPVAGSFSYFADKYCGHLSGFVSGWNYWVLYILVGMAELSAVGIYIQFWWPSIPTWESALAFFLIINALSLLNVKAFGEMEFWFAVIKVVAIVGMIGFAAPEGWPGFEIAWTLARRWWGHGYATEGARTALDYAFTHLKKDRVISLIHPDNAASIRVAERIGSSADTLLREPPKGWVVATVEQAAEQFAAYRDAGLHRIMCQTLVHDDLDAVALLGSELASRLA